MTKNNLCAALGASFLLIACAGQREPDGDPFGGGGTLTAGTTAGTAGTGTSATAGDSDGATTSGGDSAGDSAGDSTGGSTTDTSGGPKFDVGTGSDLPGAGDGGTGTGCQKIDFLFVVDNSGSMDDEQTSLATSFPGFIDAIQNTVMAQDYHLMVVDTDTYGGGAIISCSSAPSCCTQQCAAIPTATCNGNPCTPVDPNDCDKVLGAGKTLDKNEASCGITSGQRYMLDDQPDLSGTFSCLALVGTDGDGFERTMEAMVDAVTTQSAGGGCNEGFLRDDAILVVTFITDEEEQASPGNPATWKQSLVDAKNGDEDAVVVLGLLGDNDVAGGVCGAQGDADAAPILRSFAESFPHGSWGSVCAADYAPFFADAVSVVDSACDDFKPPG